MKHGHTHLALRAVRCEVWVGKLNTLDTLSHLVIDYAAWYTNCPNYQTLLISWPTGKVHGSLARAGKVKGQTPKVHVLSLFSLYLFVSLCSIHFVCNYWIKLKFSGQWRHQHHVKNVISKLKMYLCLCLNFCYWCQGLMKNCAAMLQYSLAWQIKPWVWL